MPQSRPVSYRPSRVSGNPAMPQSRPVPLPSFPRKRESGTVRPETGILPISRFEIPAYAGMTVRWTGMTVAGMAGFPLTRE